MYSFIHAFIEEDGIDLKNLTKLPWQAPKFLLGRNDLPIQLLNRDETAVCSTYRPSSSRMAA